MRLVLAKGFLFVLFVVLGPAAGASASPPVEGRIVILSRVFQDPQLTPMEIFHSVEKRYFDEVDQAGSEIWGYVFLNHAHSGGDDVRGAPMEIQIYLEESSEKGKLQLDAYLKRHDGESYLGVPIAFVPAVSSTIHLEVNLSIAGSSTSFLDEKEWVFFDRAYALFDWLHELGPALRRRDLAKIEALVRAKLSPPLAERFLKLLPVAPSISFSGQPQFLMKDSDVLRFAYGLSVDSSGRSGLVSKKENP